VSPAERNDLLQRASSELSAGTHTVSLIFEPPIGEVILKSIDDNGNTVLRLTQQDYGVLHVDMAHLMGLRLRPKAPM
jgi:hypothetical protein